MKVICFVFGTNFPYAMCVHGLYIFILYFGVFFLLFFIISYCLLIYWFSMLFNWVRVCVRMLYSIYFGCGGTRFLLHINKPINLIETIRAHIDYYYFESKKNQRACECVCVCVCLRERERKNSWTEHSNISEKCWKSRKNEDEQTTSISNINWLTNGKIAFWSNYRRLD